MLKYLATKIIQIDHDRSQGGGGQKGAAPP